MAKNSTIPVRVGFYEYPHNREALSTKDCYFKNCFPEKVESGIQGNEKYEIVKRPGLGTATYNQTDGAGRGLYVWNGDIYYVVGNAVYKNGSALTVTLANTTGKVYWEQMSGGSASEKIFLLDNQDMYSIVSSGTVTKHTTSPASAQIGTVAGGIANLNGLLYVCDTDGKILMSDYNAANPALGGPNTTAANVLWAQPNIISANVYSDGLKGVCRHLNYVVGIGDWSTEFFYDAGNTSGSLLSRAEGTVIRYGTPNFDTMWQDENLIVWLARSRDGGNCVMVLDGLTPKIVSTKAIDRILNSGKVSDAYGFGIRIVGHVFYFLTLPTLDKTLCFSLTDNMWSEWSSYDGATETYFKIQDIKGYLDANGAIAYAALHASNGSIYPLDADNYQDVGQSIRVKLVTDKVDFQTNQRKFLPHLSLMTTLVSNSTAVNVSMRYTDDDFKTWSTSSDRDLRYIATWKALGSFNRRAFEFTFTDNFPLRIETLEFGLKLGSYAQGRGT